MPPKTRKVLRIKGKWSTVGEPRVIIRPLKADSSCSGAYRYTAKEAPTASLFNKPEMSDIKLKVGDQTFYAHRLVLCSASDVFAKMLGTNWLESKQKELILGEEEECVKVFESFLYFFYSGIIDITDSYVIPLFMLADKYNVILLYGQCVKMIEKGLKVYIVARTVRSGESDVLQASHHGSSDPYDAGPSTSSMGEGPFSSASSCSDSSDTESTEGEAEMSSKIMRISENSSLSVFPTSSSAGDGQVPQSPVKKTVKHLVASETFPLTLVVKMLTFCQDERISNAALYNLEARLCNQILHNNFGVWNDLPQSLVVRILHDDFCYLKEYLLFCAAKSWLYYKEERQTEEIMTDVLCCIRYPILTADDLYVVEKDEILQDCPEACKLVREAVRYNLYRTCARAMSEEDWTGKQFENRQVKDDV